MRSKRHCDPARRPAWRLGHYLRARMRRRIFAWFGASILVTGLFTGALARLVGPGSGGWYFLVGAAVLWAASGFIALRLTRPLAQLVQVTRQIGAGKLDARMHLPRFGHNELQVIAEAINDMAARIEKQIADQRELLAAVSHEIRTPLGHMRVLLDLAAERDAEPELVAELEHEVRAIDGLVDQLLASSRVDFGNLEHRDLDGVQLGLRALERAGLEPTLLDADAEIAPLEGDAALLLQALANLLRNAAEHGGGPTILRVRSGAGEVVFEVDDDGPGFPPDDLDAAFDAFHRGRAPKPRAGSLGLGLVLVRRIAVAHGGRATAENQTGGGARVSLAIPIRAPAPPEA
jgi:two-component system OmpR family sensor kinase